MKNLRISADEVKKIAKLSGLSISEEDCKKYSEEFTDTLKYISVLEELETAAVLETYQVTGTTNVFMKGAENKVTLTNEEALSNASDAMKGLFATKGVFDR